MACTAILRIDGVPFTCTLDHDPQSGNPDESPHEYDMGRWSFKWADRDSGATDVDFPIADTDSGFYQQVMAGALRGGAELLLRRAKEIQFGTTDG